MAAIASGLNFSTLSQEGIALNICNTINTSTAPEYPALPFALGTQTVGLDGSEWIYAKPASNYAIGIVGYFDTSWNFTALPVGALTTVSGLRVGVMSQVAATVASPSSTNYEGVWVQISGLCPAIQCAASTSANVQLYNMAATTVGQLTSTSSGNSAVNGIIITTATTGAATAVGVLNYPEIILTT